MAAMGDEAKFYAEEVNNIIFYTLSTGDLKIVTEWPNELIESFTLTK